MIDDVLAIPGRASLSFCFANLDPESYYIAAFLPAFK
jgi:hypothetical protein